MAKKKGRYSSLKPAGPDDPIYQQGLTIFTPYVVRQKPPEQSKNDEADEEPREEK